MAVTAFKPDISDATLADLRQRLRSTRWPDKVADSGWAYGFDTDVLRDIASYWADGFDWNAARERIHASDHAMVDVDGFALHIIRRGPVGPGPVIPLLVMHGLPSSFVQMLPLLDALPVAETAHGITFDVVVVSLPGYGFSDIPCAPGMNMQRAGALMTRVMAALGHERFAIRASDVGGAIARQICLNDRDRVLGLHISGTNPFLPPKLPADLTAEEQTFVEAARAWGASDGGYAHMHTTRPQTLAHALNDSPVGLAAWILEKFRDWGDTDGDLLGRFDRDALLANLTIYWATGTINSSMRLNIENIRDPGSLGRVQVPTGVLMGPKDMIPTPKSWVNRSYNVVSWKDADAGGHFMEWEEPVAVADNLCLFFANFIS
jgi:pimeloyl-ACP methyl ester carboxylesterase